MSNVFLNFFAQQCFYASASNILEIVKIFINDVLNKMCESDRMCFLRTHYQTISYFIVAMLFLAIGLWFYRREGPRS